MSENQPILTCDRCQLRNDDDSMSVMCQITSDIAICDVCVRLVYDATGLGDYTVKELVHESHDIAFRKGWFPLEPSVWTMFPALLALIHSEVSEALAEHRDGRALTEVYYNEDAPDKPLGIPIELADIVLRVASLCGEAGIDLEAAIKTKNEYNETRPHRHGGKIL